MNYPSIEQVNEASPFQVCYWYRFLPSPGENFIGTKEFELCMEEEAKIMNRIVERVRSESLMTVSMSKDIGWEG